MKNRLKSAIHQATIATGILAGLILTNKDALAQTIASNGKNKADIENTNGASNDANALAYTDPLTFTLQNINNYFPDQESVQQANLLINRLGKGTIRNQVNQLIIENIVNNISDPKQQIWTIMYGLEQYVFLGNREIKPTFSNTNKVEDTNNFRSSRRFGRAFHNRFTTNLEQMNKDIEQMNKDIEQMNKDIEQGRERLEKNRLEIENMMQFITPDIVKSDANIRNIIIQRQQRYKDLNQTPTNPHIISLFEALK